MTFQLPPAVQLAERVMLEIEQAAAAFPRRHRYTLGSRLREHAFNVATLAHKAWRDRARQAQWLGELVWAVDSLKLNLQLGMRLKAFSSFGQFEAIARQVNELGKQVGGWHRQRQPHPNGQNPQRSAAAERAEILSTRGASAEAIS